MSTAEQAINDPENPQSSKKPKNPHSRERQKKLTWEPLESITPDPYREGGPHIKVSKRSDDKVASLARNSKRPYVQIDINVASELIRTNDYERAKQLFSEGLVKKEERAHLNQKAIEIATRGKIRRLLPSWLIGGGNVTKTDILPGDIHLSFITLPTKETCIVVGKENPRVIPVPKHASEHWGPALLEREVHRFLFERACNHVKAQDRSNAKKQAKKGKGASRQKGGKAEKSTA